MTVQTHVSLSPLRLNRYFLKSLNFSLHEGYDWGKVPDGVEIEIPALQIGVVTSQNPDNERQWRIELDLDLAEPPEKNFPYKFAATMVGIFTIDSRFPKEKIEHLANVAGPSFLYGTARDMISAITNRSPFPPLILQSAVFSAEKDNPSPTTKRVGASQPKQLKAKPKRARKVAMKK